MVKQNGARFFLACGEKSFDLSPLPKQLLVTSMFLSNLRKCDYDSFRFTGLLLKMMVYKGQAASTFR